MLRFRDESYFRSVSVVGLILVPESPAPHRAATAANWRSVVVMDALLGFVVLLLGIGIIVTLVTWLGVLVCALAVGYLWLVAERYRSWKRWRQSAGLEV